MGRFDLFLVVEVSDIAAVRAFVAILPDYVTTETLAAFSPDNVDSEFIKNAKKIIAVLNR